MDDSFVKFKRKFQDSLIAILKIHEELYKNG